MLRCTREALVPVGSARRAVWWVAQASKRASFREGCSWANESRRTSVHQRVESVSPAFDRRRHRVCQARSSTRQDAQLLYSTTTWNAKHGCGQIPLVFAAARRRSLSNTATLSHFAEPPTTASRAVSSPSSARPDSRDARSAQLVLPSRYPCTSTPRPRWGQPPSSTPFQRSVATRHQWFAGPPGIIVAILIFRPLSDPLCVGYRLRAIASWVPGVPGAHRKADWKPTGAALWFISTQLGRAKARRRQIYPQGHISAAQRGAAARA
jgi:hypothetical protein